MSTQFHNGKRQWHEHYHYSHFYYMAQLEALLFYVHTHNHIVSMSMSVHILGFSSFLCLFFCHILFVCRLAFIRFSLIFAFSFFVSFSHSVAVMPTFTIYIYIYIFNLHYCRIVIQSMENGKSAAGHTLSLISFSISFTLSMLLEPIVRRIAMYKFNSVIVDIFVMVAIHSAQPVSQHERIQTHSTPTHTYMFLYTEFCLSQVIFNYMRNTD